MVSHMGESFDPAVRTSRGWPRHVRGSARAWGAATLSDRKHVALSREGSGQSARSDAIVMSLYEQAGIVSAVP